MEITVPVSISVLGHPLVKMAMIAWSATAGMVPQALLFSSEGGSAKTTLTSPNPQLESIQYRTQIAFANSPSDRCVWYVETKQVIPISAGGDAIKIDLSSWVYHFVLQFQGRSDAATDISTSTTDHLVVNLVWKGTHLSAPVKRSQRMTDNTSWDIFYICPADHQISVTLSAFGVIDRQMIKLSTQLIDPTQSPLSLSVDHNQLQLTA